MAYDPRKHETGTTPILHSAAHRLALVEAVLSTTKQVDGGGARFRESYNIRNIGGVRFADYNNYKPTEKRMDVNNFDRLLEQDSLSLLSKIELEDVEVVIDID